LKNLFQISAALAFGFLNISCSHAAPLLKQETTCGPIQYSLHSPEAPARQHVILAHGFLRSPETMDHLAKALAASGIETACIKLKHSTPWNGSHSANARDMIALRQALSWESVTYAGFSAGGLSALIAASEDKACTKLLLFDPVDQATLGKDSAPKVRVPTLALLCQPGPGNAHRNASAMLAAIPGCRIVDIPDATHCDFEARPSTLCHRLTGSPPDPKRTASVHEILIRESIGFLNQPGCKNVSHPGTSKHAAAYRRAYNPYTGTYAAKGYRATPYGTVSGGRAYNPYTGASAAGGRASTAYGSAGRAAAYNPLTGKAAAGPNPARPVVPALRSECRRWHPQRGRQWQTLLIHLKFRIPNHKLPVHNLPHHANQNTPRIRPPVHRRPGIRRHHGSHT
jgi:predicted alpha/beta-hydrolase family hydrolase